jgi:hypothetical protein
MFPLSPTVLPYVEKASNVRLRAVEDGTYYATSISTKQTRGGKGVV